jgi:hypothetical protein
MKKNITLILVIAVAGVFGVLLLGRREKPNATAVQAAIQRIAPRAISIAPETTDVSDKAKLGKNVIGITVTDATALSSFLASQLVADLTAEQQARLELFLQQSRKATYELLVEMGKAARMPDGSISIEIDAQGAGLNAMRDFIQAGIAEIVGPEKMKSLDEELGSKFEAKFAYFGRYDTAIHLSLDHGSGALGAPTYVTMQSEYRRVNLLGIPSGLVRSTSVDRKQRFESNFFSVDRVISRI